MNRWLKAGVGILLLAVVLWVVWLIINFLVSLVLTILQIAIVFALLAVLLYLAFFVISKLRGGGGSASGRTTERERIFE